MRVIGTLALLGAASFGQSIVFRDVRVFDGERTTARTTVVVTAGHIVAVGASAAAPAGAGIIDGNGKTLLPGLIDAHTHTIDASALRQAAIFGVTATLDMFTDPKTAQKIRANPAAGAADFRSAGYLATSPKGHGTEYGMAVPTLTSPNEAQAWVDARVAEGSDYIKIIYDDGTAYGFHFATISNDILKALVEAAHKRGKLAVVHIGTLREAEDAIRAGADGLVHLFTGGPTEPGFGKLVAEHHAFVVPTLSVMCGAGFNGKFVEDPSLKPYLPLSEQSNMKRTFASVPKCEGTYEAMKQLRAEHVPLLTGSDALNPGTTQGATVHGELELLVKAGLSPEEALRAATSVPARVFRLKDRGTIAAGKRADLLLVDGDPTVDVRATRKIAGVWANGVEVDREAWKAQLEKAAAEEVRHRAAPAPEGSESGWISDFEGEKVDAKFGAGWLVSLDSMMGGKSQAKMDLAAGGAGGSKSSLAVTGEVMPGFAYPWAGVMFSPGKTPMAPANLSTKKAIMFWTRGDGQTYRILVFAQKLGYQPATRTFVAGPDWKQVRFTLEQFGVDGGDIMAFVWCGGPQPGKFEFRLDDVRLE